MDETLKIKGHINIKHFRAGVLINERDLDNLIPTAGKALLAALLCGSGSPAAVTYLALGTGATAAAVGNTALEAEITDTGLGRGAATVNLTTTTVTDDTALLAKSWTATGPKVVTELGAFNHPSVGTILGRQVFASVSVENTDQLAVTYRFQIS